jgi:RND family efflux transporter MFP subunit
MKKIISFVKRHKILTIFLVALLLILAITIPLRIKASAEKRKPQTVEVKKSNLRSTVSASGLVESESQVDLKFQTSGLLTWVGVKEGDRIKKWQAVASLDKRELEQSLLKTLRDYNKERWDFEEDSQVTYKDQLVTDTLKRILEKNQFDLDKAVADVEIKNLAIKLSTLVSPIEGIVTHIDAPIAGVNVTPATAVFTVANPGAMKFIANIDEVDIAKVKEGQKAIVMLDAHPNQEFQGEVGKVSFASITTKGGGTAFPIEIKMPTNENLQFRVGMNGDVEIILEEKENVLIVPNQAISQKKDKSFVKILQKNKTKEVEVKTGMEGETQTEIIEGLEEGQQVITSEKL